MISVQRAQLVNSLAALIASSAPFNGLKARLFQNNVIVSQNTFITVTPADGGLVECTFDGYAESAALVFGVASNAPDGSAICSAPTQVVRATDGIVQQVAYGYYLVIPGVGTLPDTLVAAENFPAPQSIVNADDAVKYIPVLKLAVSGQCLIPQ